MFAFRGIAFAFAFDQSPSIIYIYIMLWYILFSDGKNDAKKSETFASTGKSKEK